VKTDTFYQYLTSTSTALKCYITSLVIPRLEHCTHNKKSSFTISITLPCCVIQYMHIMHVTAMSLHKAAVSLLCILQTGFTFLVLAHPHSPKGPLNGCCCCCCCIRHSKYITTLNVPSDSHTVVETKMNDFQ